MATCSSVSDAGNAISPTGLISVMPERDCIVNAHESVSRKKTDADGGIEWGRLWCKDNLPYPKLLVLLTTSVDSTTHNEKEQ